MRITLNDQKPARPNPVKKFKELPKKTKIIIIAVILGIVAVIGAAISSAFGTTQQFVGTWYEIDEYGEEVYNGETVYFASDGTGSVDIGSGPSGSLKWSVEDGKLIVTVSMCGMTQTSEASYEFSGDTLILTDEEGEQTFYRKKQ